MPELVEVEAYRRLAEARALGRPIDEVDAPDAWFLKAGLDAVAVRDALVGGRFGAARRHGKLLLLDVAPHRPTLGLRFGMTGRLLVDGAAGVDRLLYASGREHAGWDRFAVRFADGGRLAVRDPRHLGGVLLDPDLDALGPDAAALTAAQLRRALAGGRGPLKAALMDQGRVAGLGNLMTDELLWRAGLDPARAAGSLDAAELRRLHRAVRDTVRLLVRRGGSHTGELQEHRREGGVCPRDGAPLQRRTVGGRTTWSCTRHQV